MSKTEDGNTVMMEFSYNHAGLRTKKVKKVSNVITETTEYILNGKNVVELIHTNHDTSEVNRLHFYYDAQGRVALVDFNGTPYSYAHNLQGDIIGILDNSGNLVVEYRYDAWGKPVSTHGSLTTTLGELNPFRYRGYVWDGETELYYLRSRYYNMQSSRFTIYDSKIDELLCIYTLLSLNTFSYCSNSPEIRRDKNGFNDESAIEKWIKEHREDDNFDMAWFEVQYRQALSNADITNKKAHKQVVTGNEILKSIIYPIPEQPLKDIKRNLKPLANNAKILFAFSNSPTHYTVYVEKREGGAIYRVDYTYKSYSLRRDQPLYEVMDFLEDASNVPEISNIYPADLTVLVFLWSQIKDYEFPPELSGNWTYIYGKR